MSPRNSLWSKSSPSGPLCLVLRLLRISKAHQPGSVNIRLHAIYGIKSLVQEQANGATGIDPGRTIGVQIRVVPHNSDEIDYNEHESGEGDLPRKEIRFVYSE